MLRINNIKITFYPTTFQPIPKLFYYRPSTFIQTTKKDIRFIFLLNRNIQYGTNLIVKLKIMFNCIYFIKSYNHVKLFPIIFHKPQLFLIDSGRQCICKHVEQF